MGRLTKAPRLQTFQPAPHHRPAPLRLFRLLALALAAAALLPQFLSPPVPDVAWLLYSAGRLLDGARIPQDLVEINPPLIVWLNLPAVGLSRLLGIPDILAYRALTAMAAIGSIMVASRILARPNRRLIPLLLVILLALPLADFGEREHLLLILSLPYIAAIAARAEGRTFGSAGAVAIGATAALGIALKPYFLTLPLALETWLLVRGHRTVRPELLGMATGFALYIAAALTLAPGYLDVARLLGPAYLGYLREPVLVTAITGEGAGLPLFAMVAALALRHRLYGRASAQALLVATVALFLSAVLQQKGWRYHFYPSMGLGLLLLADLALHPARDGEGVAARLYGAAALATLAFVPPAVVVDGLAQLAKPRDERMSTDPDRGRLAALLRREAPGGSLLVLSSNMASAFPLVTEAGVRWTSRFPSVWPLAAAYEERLAEPGPLGYRLAHEQGSLERYLQAAVAEDFHRGQPDILVVLQPAPDLPEWGVRRLDYLRYFSQEPAFAAELARYGFLADVGEYRVYRRARNNEAPGPPPVTAPTAGTAPVVLRPGLQLAPPSPATMVRGLAFLLLFGVALARPGVLRLSRG